MKALALYDFDGQPGTAELSIKAGETLTVTNTDVGEGWWEGANDSGGSGIFPAAYVEEVNLEAPPPPPPEKDYEPQTRTDDGPSPWNQDFSKSDDWDDDDWDDDASEIGGISTVSQATDFSKSHMRTGRSASAGDINQVSGKFDGRSSISRRSFNPFSSFTKTGGDAFILGETKIGPITDAQKVLIIESGSLIIWPENPFPYTVAVASPKKESKLKGLKSFIAYQLTPSVSYASYSLSLFNRSFLLLCFHLFTFQ
ncbi:hypothetical protein QYM36_018379 [Artemia franciscana]|uniref:SH3 domain-containing protein n=1 Tax=Artemia franciscana TaxID=6661 RepID=A0AA88H9N6_ARTSF|nr:hypothetical protein QYM36_018379 [Artemia franciscana]